MRCKHKNGKVIEVMWAHHERIVEDGEMEEEGHNEILDISHYLYRCKDCGREYRFQDLTSAPLKFLREQEF